MSNSPTSLATNAAERAAACLRTLAHPIRLRIADLLLNRELSVRELAQECAIPEAAMSGHLGKMRDRGLLSQERRGREVYYRVAEPALAGILGCVHRRFGEEEPEAPRGKPLPRRSR
ncbi:MAG: metalloregulator ArsR/SmtB family transcription factor [bacterium]|nr:winged helix-turn-helix transcriptional regulator [Gemmatimonadota bacterium]